MVAASFLAGMQTETVRPALAATSAPASKSVEAKEVPSSPRPAVAGMPPSSLTTGRLVTADRGRAGALRSTAGPTGSTATARR